MVFTDLLDLGIYSQRYKLDRGFTGLTKIIENPIDLDAPGAIMHGSQRDPYTILKYGLAPQKTKSDIDCEWQICIGLSASDRNLRISKHLAKKNSAIQYSGNFSTEGVVYLLDESIKKLPGYSEFWDKGEDGRGYGWLTTPLSTDYILAVITENIPLVAAAMLAAEKNKPIYKKDGTCYTLAPI
jgi:hypothetical protein